MKKLMILLFCLMLPSAWAESNTSALAKEINASKDWAGDLARCPADLIPATSQPDYNHGVKAQCETASSQPACMAACKAGKGEYCYWLGVALQTLEQDDRASDILFQRSCKLGVASGCTNRAATLMPERPAKVDAQSCPARTFERTCEANDPWGCSMYGFILGGDKSNPRNRQKALEVLKKSCRFGEEDPACRAALAMRKNLER
jgi:hypothetical protein